MPKNAFPTRMSAHGTVFRRKIPKISQHISASSRATGYPDRHMDDFIFGNKMSTNPSGSESLSRSMSFIGQVSYSYDNRYSFDFNLSEENSSRYANNSFTPFWSTGVRWNAYREKWLEGRISNLVFRATYGITGEEAQKLSEPKKRFQDIIDALFADTGKKIVRTDNEISFSQMGETLVPYQLSSGEKQILAILLTVLVEDQKPYVLFMDEPEVSLHIEWQKKLIDLILELNPNVQIILTTHSPAVIMNGWMDKVTEVSDITI